MGIRRQARETAVQALFMCDFVGTWNLGAVISCFEHFGVASQVRDFAQTICSGVIEQRIKLDSELTCASENWSLSRMARVDRSILRLAAFELMYSPEVPTNVVINEAIEIAKRYGAPESAQFVNGVVDKIASIHRPTTPMVLREEVEVEAVSEPVEELLPAFEQRLLAMGETLD